MAKNKEIKQFALTYSQLLKESYAKNVLFTRDEPILNTRGITTARIAAFIELRNVFAQTPVNETKRAEVSIDTQNRDQIANELRAALKELWGIAVATFGKKDVNYKTFKPTSLSLVKGADLYYLAKAGIDRANLYFAEMQPKGLSIAMLNHIETLRADLLLAITNTVQTKVQRTNTTTERRIAANNLYNEMMAMCQTAFVYFENRDKLKASEYIIYKVAGKQLQRNGSLKKDAFICPKLKAISANSKFKLMVASGSSVAFYFSKNKDGVAGDKKVVVAANATPVAVFTATDLGFNKSKGYIYFCIKNMGDAVDDTVYKLRVRL